MNFTVEEAAYHRNGVGGEGFFVGVATCDVDGTERRMLVTVFPDTTPEGEPYGAAAFGRVAVLDLDVIGLVGTVAWGQNSWRGDNFYEVADAIVKEVSG